MDERAWTPLRLAERIWRIQRERFKYYHCGKKYIRDQEKHHRKMTFVQEYRALLKKHGIDPDAL